MIPKSLFTLLLIFILRQNKRVFLMFVAEDPVSRKEVRRNDGDYLDSARNPLTFAPVTYFCLLLLIS